MKASRASSAGKLSIVAELDICAKTKALYGLALQDEAAENARHLEALRQIALRKDAAKATARKNGCLWVYQIT